MIYGWTNINIIFGKKINFIIVNNRETIQFFIKIYKQHQTWLHKRLQTWGELCNLK
jgi:hypothetical protein